ncbi:hypothetical protein [Candidatus Amarobacter glycogenicus]|uniref:hypothetical protein n=1 Tax=Candidatus Amarobacter glycogenicus TaxID=3140699 RepID=UPI003136DE01|nr:hypothetical protein [Dehalococcoidia bacterium]
MNFRKLVLVTGMIPAVLGASVFAACGGDDDDDGGSGGTGTDEKYVASICKAGAEFATAMEKLSKDLASEKDLESSREGCRTVRGFRQGVRQGQPAEGSQGVA